VTDDRSNHGLIYASISCARDEPTSQAVKIDPAMPPALFPVLDVQREPVPAKPLTNRH
jgi:hypothetical protein